VIVSADGPELRDELTLLREEGLVAPKLKLR
jgi:hypothetical protein